MRYLTKQNIEDIVFIDAETTYGDPNFDENHHMFEAWKYDCAKTGIVETEEIIAEYFKISPLKPEYGRISVITMGVVRKGEIYLKSFSGDEKKLLEEFNAALEKTVTPKSWLCGHSIIGFDGPYIMKRCLINNVDLHKWFDVAHLKPWEVPYLDIAVLWKGTAYRMSSLVSMCSSLGVPTPKDDISGAEAPKLYWQGEIKRIVRYCEKDVVATIQCFRKMCNRDLLDVTPGAYTIEADILTYLVSGGQYNKEVKEKLEEFLGTLSKAEHAIAIEILEAIPTKAKGKETDFTKKHIKELVS